MAGQDAHKSIQEVKKQIEKTECHHGVSEHQGKKGKGSGHTELCSKVSHQGK